MNASCGRSPGTADSNHAIARFPHGIEVNLRHVFGRSRSLPGLVVLSGNGGVRADGGRVID